MRSRMLRILCGMVWSLLILGLPNQGLTAIQYNFESPQDGPVAGVAVMRGWAFDQEGAVITRVDIVIDDGELIIDVPCCAARPDVDQDAALQAAFPDADRLNSGWGAVFNWGNLSAGLHTVRVEIDSADGDSVVSESRSVTVIKPGDFTFLSDFSLENATASIEGQEVVIENVLVQDSASGQQQSVTVRFVWSTAAQGLTMVSSQAFAQAPTQLFRFASWWQALRQLLPSIPFVSSAQAAIGSTSRVESPLEGIVAGVTVARGWVFDTEGATITSVILSIDGVPFLDIPCCSVRPDVDQDTALQAAFPDADRLNSGWGAVLNWGNFSGGNHTAEIKITTATAEDFTDTQAVTVVKPGGFNFIQSVTFGPTARIENGELVLEDVLIADFNSAETVTRTLRFRWDTAAQGLALVSQSTGSDDDFFDDFEDGVADGWTTVNGTWDVVDGEFAQTSNATGTRFLAINGPTVTDLLLTAQVRTTDDDDIGLIYRFRDANNFSVAVFNPQNQRVSIDEIEDGVRSTVEVITGIEPLIFNRIRRPFGLPVEVAVWAEQENVRVFVNGRQVIATSEAPVAAGRIGLFSNNNRNSVFDDVRVVDPSTLENVSVPSNIVYVNAANEGGTENGLTPETGWGTIQEALDDPRFRDTVGNTILVKGGVYREQVDVFAEQSGLPGAFNTIKAVDGETVIVDGERGTPNERVECILIHTGVAYFRIEGLYLRNAQHRGILVFLSGPGELVNNLVYDSGDSGIEFWFGARNYTAAHNFIFRNDDHGIIIAEGSGDDPSRFRDNRGLIIRNNVILNSGDNGIFAVGDQPHTFIAYNNTIVDNAGNGVSAEAGVKGTDIRNNIIVSNSLIGLKNEIGDAMSRGYNTLFFNGASGTNNYDGTSGSGEEDGSTDTVEADPLFMDPAADDYRLQTDSPSIDTGDPATRFLDVDSSRNDMGAYGGPDPMTAVVPLP